MAQYRKFDRSSWPRKDHFRYFTETLPAGYSVTADVDVRNLLDVCHEKGLRFYASFIWCIAKILNASEHFRLFLDEDGELCVWDQLVPNYTIFHEDDKTFSDCWTDYDEDFSSFYRAVISDMDQYRGVRAVKAKPDQPANFFCISSVPWLRFTGYHSFTTGGEPKFFPVITAGKYEEIGEQIRMPVCITIAHAVCDGYHIGRFFDDLQSLLDSFDGS